MVVLTAQARWCDALLESSGGRGTAAQDAAGGHSKHPCFTAESRRLSNVLAEPPGSARACTRNSPLRNGRPRSHSGGRSGGAAPGVAGAAGGLPPLAKSKISPTGGGGGTAKASGAALPGRSTSVGTFQYAGPRLKGEFRSVCAPDARVILV